MVEDKVIFPIGGMWEYPTWELHFNFECSSYGGGIPCKHCHNFIKGGWSEVRKVSTDEDTWICPRVIIVKNEGGCNSTGLCADCVLELMETIK